MQQLVAFQSYNPVQNYYLVQNYFHCSKSWIAIKLADLLAGLLADLPADLLIQLSILCKKSLQMMSLVKVAEAALSQSTCN